jgi:probable F420-dependent oxidoreductase
MGLVKDGDMKVGLGIHRLQQFGFDPAAYAAIAQTAERAGFESLWMGDHLAFPETLPPHPYASSGAGYQEPHTPWLDPWITLTYLAAVTERIRLGTDVYILPLRNPFVTAKSLATLDILSRGRVILGVGVGWCEPEFAAVGENFRNRGRRCDELIDAIKMLWTDSVARYEGAHYDFGPVVFEPKPLQRPHPPIHYGGISQPALKRAAERCDGWIGAPQSFDELRACIEQLRELRKRAGRDHLPFEVTNGIGRPSDRDELRRYADIGVDRVTVSPWAQATANAPPVTLPEARASIEEFGQEFALAELD